MIMMMMRFIILNGYGDDECAQASKLDEQDGQDDLVVDGHDHES